MGKKEILYPILAEDIHSHTRKNADGTERKPVYVEGTLIRRKPDYGGNNVKWVSNKVYKDTLEFVRIHDSGNSVGAGFIDATGAQFYMFLSDFEEVLLNLDMVDSKVTGYWTYVKKSRYFGIRMATEKEVSEFKNKGLL